MSDLVSVIVPAYNAERFLARCADSILAQTHQNLELILIDDGSTDRTGIICDEYAARDARVVVIHQENKGVSAARNAGIDKSAGEYLVFVDADDALLPDGLEQLLFEIRLADADIGCGTGCRVREGEIVFAPVSSGRRRMLEGLDSLKGSLMDRGFTYSACANIYRKAFVGDTRFMEGKRVHEDTFFLFECFCAQPRMVLFDKCVYINYITEGSASRSGFSEKMLDMLFLADRKMEIIEQQYPALKDMAYNVIVKANMALLQNLLSTWDPQFRKQERECIKTVRRYRRYYISVSRRDDRWLMVITNRLYYCYKLVYGIRKMLSSGHHIKGGQNGFATD